jgi:group I intron endonuclease
MSDTKEIYGECYKAECLVNKKAYVGQTIQGYLIRWKQHVADAEKGSDGCTALNNAIRKHGADKFVVTVLKVCHSQEELNEAEEYYIKEHNALVHDGYNIRSGGSRTPLGEETKKKMSIAHSGENNSMFGRNHSEETKEKLRQIQLGREHSEEEKRTASKANKTDPTLPMYMSVVKARPKNNGDGYGVRYPGKGFKSFTSVELSMKQKDKLARAYLASCEKEALLKKIE